MKDRLFFSLQWIYSVDLSFYDYLSIARSLINLEWEALGYVKHEMVCTTINVTAIGW